MVNLEHARARASISLTSTSIPTSASSLWWPSAAPSPADRAQPRPDARRARARLRRDAAPAPHAWVIHRQHPGESQASFFAEGLLARLLGLHEPRGGHARDGLVIALLKQFTFHVIPNMNPDGAVRGHLRVNSSGANLNREWATSGRLRRADARALRGVPHPRGDGRDGRRLLRRRPRRRGLVLRLHRRLRGPPHLGAAHQGAAGRLPGRVLPCQPGHAARVRVRSRRASRLQPGHRLQPGRAALRLPRLHPRDALQRLRVQRGRGPPYQGERCAPQSGRPSSTASRTSPRPSAAWTRPSFQRHPTISTWRRRAVIAAWIAKRASAGAARGTEAAMDERTPRRDGWSHVIDGSVLVGERARRARPGAHRPGARGGRSPGRVTCDVLIYLYNTVAVCGACVVAILNLTCA